LIAYGTSHRLHLRWKLRRRVPAVRLSVVTEIHQHDVYAVRGEVFAVEQEATQAVAVSLVQQHRDGVARCQPPGIQPYTCACLDLFLIDAVSDGTDTYSIFLGFNDSVGTTGTDAIMFRYTHSVNSGKWECVTRSNGAETADDSGITVTTATWYKLGITVNAAATSVVFSVNGSVVQTHVANIPSGTGRQTTPWHSITKSAGTNARRLAMDYLYYKLALTSSR